MINLDLDVDELKKQFKKSNRHLTIDNFLTVDAILNLYRKLISIPENEWRLQRIDFGDIGKQYHKAENEVLDEFDSDCMVNFLQKIVPMEVSQIEQVTAQKFSKGAFLTKHTDGKNGRKLAFILHLSPNWRVEWGGLFIDHSIRDKPRTLVPGFNKLTVFDVTHGKSPHEITEVTTDAKWDRFTIVGWLK